MSKHLAVLAFEDVDSTRRYVCVDVSNTARSGYGHVATDPLRTERSIVLHRLRIAAELRASGQYDVYVGVLVRQNSVNGTVHWIQRWNMEAAGERVIDEQEFAGLPLRVDANNNKLYGIVTNLTEESNSVWNNTSGNVMNSPLGNVTPGLGDLVVLVERIAGNVDFVLSAEYEVVN